TTPSTVARGSGFLWPVLFIEASPPIFGDFPTDSSTVEEYLFGAAQIGAHDLEIEVDGKVTAIGAEYAAGPVFTPNLPDGGGSHLIQFGAFLTPLSKGTHTVTIRGTVDGAAVGEFGGSFEISYTVIVR